MQAKPIRMVVADDDANARSALAELFEDVGYEVFSAADGCQALEMIARVDPNIVLTDLQMPQLDGIGVIRKGRRIAPNARFIVMTAYDTPQNIDAVRSGGAAAYLVKPIDVHAVEAAVAQALGEQAGSNGPAQVRR